MINNIFKCFLFSQPKGIASRPHVRASKLRCWKHCGMRAGYSKWRDTCNVHEHQDEENTSWKSRFFQFYTSHKSTIGIRNLWTSYSRTIRIRTPTFDFSTSSKNKPPIISQFSLLRKLKIRKEKVQLVLVGTYQHICICLVNHEFKTVEFFILQRVQPRVETDSNILLLVLRGTRSRTRILILIFKLKMRIVLKQMRKREIFSVTLGSICTPIDVCF